MNLLNLVGSLILCELDHRSHPNAPSHSTKRYHWKTVTWSGMQHTEYQLFHTVCSHFPGAPGDHKLGSGNGCRMWFVNSWAIGWASDMQLIQKGVGRIAYWIRCHTKMYVIGPSEPMQNDQTCFFSNIFLKFYKIIKTTI